MATTRHWRKVNLELALPVTETTLRQRVSELVGENNGSAAGAAWSPTLKLAALRRALEWAPGCFPTSSCPNIRHRRREMKRLFQAALTIHKQGLD
jgi:hypothetical protein